MHGMKEKKLVVTKGHKSTRKLSQEGGAEGRGEKMI